MRRPISLIAALSFVALIAFVFLMPEHAKAAEAAANSGGMSISDIGTSVIGKFFTWPIEILILPLAGFMMFIAGYIMDFAIQFSLHTAYIFSLSPAINLGWVIVRDICNIFFIFVLIYVSLGTIINGTRFGTMNMLKNVVIAALLINFSLFFTKTLVDVSNIFGNWLYGGIQNTLVANSIEGGGKTSIAGLIAKRLGVMGFWSAAANSNGSGDTSVFGSLFSLSDPSKGYIASMFRLAVVLIATYIFMYCAILFIARSITILFLMVFSPLGFMGSVLPQIKEYSNKWWKELSAAAIFPIAFLLMLYISLQFINSLQDLKLEAYAKSVAGINITLYFQYFLVIFLLKASLKVAKENAGEVGTALGGFASSLGKLAVNAGMAVGSGGIALAGRTLAAGYFAEKGKGREEAMKTLRSGIPLINRIGTPASLKEDVKKAAKEGSYDIRNLKIPGAGPTFAESMSGMTGVKIDTKTAKEYNEQTKQFKEEIKIEEKNQTILKHLETLTKEANDLKLKELKEAAEKAPKDSSGDKARADYATALKTFNNKKEVQDARGGISNETAKMGNSDLQKLNKKVLKDEQFVQVISQSQAEGLADKAESDADKAKVWSARLSDVTAAVSSKADSKDIKKATKGHSDKELQNLPPEILTSYDFVNPDAMDFDKFDKLVKSDKIPNALKDDMRKARYKDMFAAAKSGNPDTIWKELNKLEASEIAKLGWDKTIDGTTFKVLGNPEIMYNLDTKTLKKIYEELDSEKLAQIRSEIQDMASSASAMSTLSDKAQQRVKKAVEFFKKDQIGQEF